jgi:hypothetical protein
MVFLLSHFLDLLCLNSFEGNPFLSGIGSESIAPPVGPKDGKEGCSMSNSGHFQFHFSKVN